jgi:hypothetical protein
MSLSEKRCGLKAMRTETIRAKTRHRDSQDVLRASRTMRSMTSRHPAQAGGSVGWLRVSRVTRSACHATTTA